MRRCRLTTLMLLTVIVSLALATSAEQRKAHARRMQLEADMNEARLAMWRAAMDSTPLLDWGPRSVGRVAPPYEVRPGALANGRAAARGSLCRQLAKRSYAEMAAAKARANYYERLAAQYEQDAEDSSLPVASEPPEPE
jgi:hypothetical protein